MPTISYDRRMEDLVAHAVPGGPPQRLRRLPSWLINQARVVANRCVGDRVGAPGQRTNYAVLAALEEFGSLSQAEIGRRLGIDRSDIVALLNHLEDEDLVTRARDPSDRRRNAITLTATGERRLRHMDQDVQRAQDDLLKPLDDSERETLTTLLQRVVDHHHKPD